ncbi:hypothetical protein E2C01_044344 [Portunus trituberculatus]|uniref:Uncharacterized protein n=1 Tax=Portunus trituberculatus TaxID=210409 RepID=A0A5B7FYY9_PORTR|nr:hypothetical protein [Portunus trituberculatus]
MEQWLIAPVTMPRLIPRLMYLILSQDVKLHVWLCAPMTIVTY